MLTQQRISSTGLPRSVVKRVDLNSLVEPFSPLYKCALEPHQNTSLLSTFHVANLADGDDTEILTICQKCQGLRLGGIILGTLSGQYKSYSMLLAYPLEVTLGLKLPGIRYFVRCACIVKASSRQETVTIWFAAVSFFDEHSCKVWFGHPIEVWMRVMSPDMKFIPLTHLHRQVAYTSAHVNFGCYIGTQRVYIIVPL